MPKAYKKDDFHVEKEQKKIENRVFVSDFRPKNVKFSI